jgi:hypothetical protein
MTNVIAERINLFIEIVYPEVSKKKLAELLNIDYYSFIRYTKGQTLPSLENISLFCKLGVSVNWLLLGEGSIFSHDRYGDVAKDTFLLHINALQDADLSRNLLHKDIVHGIFDRYGSVSGFYRHLDNNNIEYDQSKFDEFFSGENTIDFHVEEVLFQINFYFYLYNKDNPNLDKIEYFMENLKQSDNTDVKNSRPVNRVLTQIKEILDDYFLPQNINLKSIIVFLCLLASAGILNAQMSYTDFSTKTNIDSIYNNIRKTARIQPDSALNWVNNELNIKHTKIERAWLCEAKGWVYYSKGKYDSSFYYFMDARNIFLEQKSMRGMCAVNQHFASYFMRHRYFKKALDYNKLALEYKQSETDEINEHIPIYNKILLLNYHLERFESVDSVMSRIDSLYKIIPKDNDYVRTLIYYSYSFRARGDFVKEEEVLARALELTSTIDVSRTRKYFVIHQLAESYFAQGKFQEAIEIAELNEENISGGASKYMHYNTYSKYLNLAGNPKRAVDVFHKYRLGENNPINPVESKIDYASALIELDSVEKAKVIYAEVIDLLKKTEREYELSYISDLLKKINTNNDVTLAYELIGFLSEELLSAEAKNKELDPYSDLLLGNVLSVREEMASYSKRISTYHGFLLIVGVLLVVLLVMIIKSVRERRKLNRISKSLRYGYEVLTQQVNNELRVLTHKALAFDKEAAFRENAKEYFKEEIIKITRSIKNLIDVMNKQIKDAESIKAEKLFNKKDKS